MPKDILFSIELLETEEAIQKKILRALAEEFTLALKNKLPKITFEIQQLTGAFLKNTETYESLVNGELAAHFGLPIAFRKTMVDSIIQKIVDNIQITIKDYQLFGLKFRGEMTINVLIADFSDILSMAEAFITTEKGASLPWLEWLLIRGNQLIISEHEIHLIGGKGRSGHAIMVKNAASAWRVPIQFSGTKTDNWLTRAFKIYSDAYLDNISKILEQELQ